MGEKALEEMLQLRAKVLIGGILPSEAPPGSALAEAIAAIEEEMEDEVPCVCTRVFQEPKRMLLHWCLCREVHHVR